ncbi:hypothetical protein NDU88_002262 [Pleurodeles waltl]|uniref:Uncharacterized protein n=1 Tax=Pleurodeles waltl TaxID=8319 RepID=A0AAV7S9X3_PLEWA|nr:hypothetical protein NDU88_002262 [Pleurodeles waltl]
MSAGVPGEKVEEDGRRCVREERNATARTSGCRGTESGLEKRSPRRCGERMEESQMTQSRWQRGGKAEKPATSLRRSGPLTKFIGKGRMEWGGGMLGKRSSGPTATSSTSGVTRTINTTSAVADGSAIP